MKRHSIGVLAIGALFAIITAGSFVYATEGSHEAVTLQGELLDLGCYLDHGAKGPGHQDCAVACAKAGGPLGLLNQADETIYIVTGDHGAMLSGLEDLCGQNVVLTGHVMVRHGLAAVYPSTVRAQNAAPATQPTSRPAQ